MKKLFVSVCFVVFASFAFAYDGTILHSEYVADLSRSDFSKVFADGELAEDLIMECVKSGSFPSSISRRNPKISQLQSRDERTVDDEDLDFIKDVAKYIDENYDVESGETYAHVVVRSFFEDGSVDGWVVFTNYVANDSVPWFNYLYYFHLE